MTDFILLYGGLLLLLAPIAVVLLDTMSPEPAPAVAPIVPIRAFFAESGALVVPGRE